jgi:hypothetical protein
MPFLSFLFVYIQECNDITQVRLRSYKAGSMPKVLIISEILLTKEIGTYQSSISWQLISGLDVLPHSGTLNVKTSRRKFLFSFLFTVPPTQFLVHSCGRIQEKIKRTAKRKKLTFSQICGCHQK